MTRVAVRQIRDAEDRDAARALVGEFFDALPRLYPARAETVRTYLRDYDVAAQLARFEDYYEPPAGHCFLAFVDGAPMGVVKLRPHGEAGGELNRMFVRDAARGRGCGKALVAALIETARGKGYRYIYLNSLAEMTDAHALYSATGFRFIAAEGGYRADDAGIVHMRMDLVAGNGGTA